MKQSSESRACILYITRDCVMLFNPHEYKVFQTEHILSGSGLKGWVGFGGVGGGVGGGGGGGGGSHFATHQAGLSQVK